MSRIELDAIDRGSVKRARELLAQAETFDDSNPTKLALALGDALGAVDILLRVLDGGEER